MFQKATSFFVGVIFLVFKSPFSPEENTYRDTFLKTSLSGCPLFFKRIVKLCTSLLNEERDG